jgi:putative flippase GtrA
MKKELGVYIVVGIGSVIIDYCVYMILSLFVSVIHAKMISYIVGMGFGFFCNRAITFKSNNSLAKDAIGFLFVYTASLFLNVIVNSVTLIIIPEQKIIAFLVATTVSIITNYLGQKFFVYKK